MKLIDKDALVAEIERLLAFYLKEIEGNKEDPWAMDIAKRDILQEILSFLDTLEVKEVDLENYNKVKRLLSLSFMHFLDKNRPQGKMCLSNMECVDIDKAFDEMDWAKLFRYLQKYLEETQKGEEV